MITNNNLENECSICQENYLGGPYSRAPVSLQFGPVFGRRFIVKWSKESLTCPLCRHVISSQEFAIPESLIKRLLERALTVSLNGLLAYNSYLGDRHASIKKEAASTFIVASAVPLLFLAHKTVIWCLSDRSNPLLSPRAKQMIGKQLHWVLDTTIGRSIGVAVAAYIKHIS